MTVLLARDDNYKNRLQVIIQKEFKLTPDYVEIKNTDHNYDKDKDKDIECEKFYNMGVYICFGQNIHNANINTAINLTDYNSFKLLHNELEKNHKLLIFMSSAEHKIKKKAEQIACLYAINIIEKYIT